MRKLSAVILLFPLMAMFVAAVRLPSQCPKLAMVYCQAVAAAKAETHCPMMGKMDHQCMMSMMKQHKKDVAAKGKAAGPGERKDAKKDAGCCMDCPAFCLATFKPLIRFELMRTLIKTEYTVVSDNNLSDYYKQPWKPPCPVLLS